MDASSQCLSSFNCEVNIITAKNMEFINKPKGNFFVRCYISAGNNRRVQLNTREISSSRSSSDDFFWNECFPLECLGTEHSIDLLSQGNVVFELRCRCRGSGSFLGRIINGGGSNKLLGRAEIPWKNVFESPNMEIETWVPMISKNKHRDIVKPPKVQVRMKFVGEVPKIITDRRRSHDDGLRRRRRRRPESCGCEDGSGCRCVDYVDYDLFALGYALDTLED